MRFFHLFVCAVFFVVLGACPQAPQECETGCVDAGAVDGDAGSVGADAGAGDAGALADVTRPDRASPDRAQPDRALPDTGRDAGATVDAAPGDRLAPDAFFADRASPDQGAPQDAYVAADATGVDAGGPEICDGLDNDGVGGADDGLTPPDICNQRGVCAGTAAMCTGVGGWKCFYSQISGYEASETSCDGLDNDCDGQADNALTPPAICEQRGVCAGTVATCGGAQGWACSYTSADYQASEDRCDGRDNDCDGQTDECADGLACHSSVAVCTDVRDIDFDGDGLSERQGDCAPQDAEVKPGLDDVVDGRDNDCDGFVDEFTDGEGQLINTTRAYLPAAHVQPTAEYDYWPVELPAGHYHARLIAYPQGSADLIAGLFDASGALLGQRVNATGAGGYEILTFDVASAPLWIGVSSTAGTTGPYRLAVFPGDYDSGTIAGGDGDVSMAAVPAGELVVGATSTDTDLLGNSVTGDELFALDLSGTLSDISRYHIANMRIRDVDLSPDRTRIAFASNWNNGRDDIYVLDLVAQRTRRLSPNSLSCPDNYALVGFAHPSFIDDDNLVFLGECLSMVSAFNPPVDQILKAPADASAAAVGVTFGGNGCMTPYLIPRAMPGGSEVAVSSGGCTIAIEGETLTGGKVTRYRLSDGSIAGDLPAQFGPTFNVHHKLAGWDINSAGSAYAVCTEEGVLEFATSDGSLIRGWTYLSSVGRPASGDYWNRETLRYSRDGGRVAYLRHNANDYFDVYVLDLSNGGWTSLVIGLQIRRGAAW